MNIENPDQPFTADPAQSFTLPARFYTDPDIFRAEQAAIFQKAWYYAGHVSQVAQPGQFLTCRINDQNTFCYSGPRWGIAGLSQCLCPPGS